MYKRISFKIYGAIAFSLLGESARRAIEGTYKNKYLYTTLHLNLTPSIPSFASLYYINVITTNWLTT